VRVINFRIIIIIINFSVTCLSLLSDISSISEHLELMHCEKVYLSFIFVVDCAIGCCVCVLQ